MTKRVFLFSFAALALTAILANESAGQAKPKVIVATDDHYGLLATYKDMVGVVQGTVAALGKSPASITLRVQFDHVKNPNAQIGPTNAQITRMQKLQADLANTASIKEPDKRAQKVNKIQGDIATLQAQMQAAANKPVPMVKEFIDYDLPLTEKVVLRKKTAGNDSEAAKDKDGFPAKFEDLNKGDEVKVTFAEKAAAKTTPPKKDENGALVEFPANRPRIRMVVITKDVPEPPAKKKGK